MKACDIIKKIEDDGCRLVRQKGSHKQYSHKIKKGLVTIAAYKMSDEIALGTLNSILNRIPKPHTQSEVLVFHV